LIDESATPRYADQFISPEFARRARPIFTVNIKQTPAVVQLEQIIPLGKFETFQRPLRANARPGTPRGEHPRIARRVALSYISSIGNA
jgi:hypothetical protein